jgi:predicted ribosome quality control (RQC) complex YloA/Tae2 family protein
LAVVQERQRTVQDRLGSLQAAQRSLPALRAVAELEKAYRELFPAKEAAAKAAAARASRKPAAERVATPNIRRERIAKGFELCVGTSAAANEHVTFQLAQPEDLWFHVRDLPGSHVVLRKLERSAEVTEELILEAAKRAASQSKAGPGGKVTVAYTERKNVKRIPGAPAGMVSISKERTVTLEVPDSQQLTADS